MSLFSLIAISILHFCSHHPQFPITTLIPMIFFQQAKQNKKKIGKKNLPEGTEAYTLLQYRMQEGSGARNQQERKSKMYQMQNH